MKGVKYIAPALLVLGLAFSARGLWIPAKALLAEALLEQAHSEVARFGAPARPWSWADFFVIGELDIGGDTLPLLDRATGQALAFGVGRHEEFAADGPLVISGHRDTHFSVLGGLAVGDPLTLREGKAARGYRVTDLRIFDLREGHIIAPGPGQMLLITCWPFDGIDPGTTRRYLVLAERTG